MTTLLTYAILLAASYALGRFLGYVDARRMFRTN